MKKTILNTMLFLFLSFSYGQNKLLLSPNVVEVRNNTTNALIRKYSNIVSVQPSPSLANFIRINNISEPYDINYATIIRYSINGGVPITTTTLNDLIEIIQSNCVVRVGGGSSGGSGGGGGDASASNQLLGNASLSTIASNSNLQSNAQNQININANLIDIKGNTTIQKGVVLQNDTFIALGGTSQVALALNSNRTGFEVINNSTVPIYISLSGNATLQSIKINPNSSYSRYTGKIPTNAISVLGTITGQEITILESN